MAEKVVFMLRAPTLDDAPALCEMANMPRYRWGTMRMPFQSLIETRAYLERVIGSANDRHVGAYVDSRLIGMAGLSRFQGRRSHAAELGIGVHDGYQGRGIGTALLGALIDLADNWWNVPRLELGVFADNTGAIKLYHRFGFIEEGTRKGHAFRDGAYADVVMMARWRP
jgi:putative acetyltransferase